MHRVSLLVYLPSTFVQPDIVVRMTKKPGASPCKSQYGFGHRTTPRRVGPPTPVSSGAPIHRSCDQDRGSPVSPLEHATTPELLSRPNPGSLSVETSQLQSRNAVPTYADLRQMLSPVSHVESSASISNREQVSEHCYASGNPFGDQRYVRQPNFNDDTTTSKFHAEQARPTAVTRLPLRDGGQPERLCYFILGNLNRSRQHLHGNLKVDGDKCTLADFLDTLSAGRYPLSALHGLLVVAGAVHEHDGEATVDLSGLEARLDAYLMSLD